jgi:hypothetical protein
MKITSAVASWYTVDGPNAHGLILTLSGTKQEGYQPDDLKLNVVGEVWNAVPSVIASLVQWSFLPLPLIPDYLDKNSFHKGEQFIIQLFLGTKKNGTPGGVFPTSLFSHASVLPSTIQQRLNEQISQSQDPVFLIELLDYKNEQYCGIVTRPSLILASLHNGCDLQYTGPDTPSFVKTDVSGGDHPGLWIWVVPILTWATIGYGIYRWKTKQ